MTAEFAIDPTSAHPRPWRCRHWRRPRPFRRPVRRTRRRAPITSLPALIGTPPPTATVFGICFRIGIGGIGSQLHELQRGLAAGPRRVGFQPRRTPWCADRCHRRAWRPRRCRPCRRSSPIPCSHPCCTARCVPWMMASAIAIEIFFSTCGACASAGEVARTDKDASTARRTRRMLLASLRGLRYRALLNPRLARLVPGEPRIRRADCRKRQRALRRFYGVRAGSPPAAPAPPPYRARHRQTRISTTR